MTMVRAALSCLSLLAYSRTLLTAHDSELIQSNQTMIFSF